MSHCLSKSNRNLLRKETCFVYYTSSVLRKSRHHCKEMGAKLGRRFLKQPAEKLKAVFVA